MEVVFSVTKETKKYLVLKGDGADPAIESVSVKKSLFPGITVGGRVTMTLNVPTPPVVG